MEETVDRTISHAIFWLRRMERNKRVLMGMNHEPQFSAQRKVTQNSMWWWFCSCAIYVMDFADTSFWFLLTSL